MVLFLSEVDLLTVYAYLLTSHINNNLIQQTPFLLFLQNSQILSLIKYSIQSLYEQLTCDTFGDQTIQLYKLNQEQLKRMEKGLVVKKEIFIMKSKEDIHKHYDIDNKQIGKGAYGKIFLGRPKDKSNIVRAIKMIKKDITNAHYMNEAMILKQLDHPNVLKLYAIFEDSKAYYLVTDYLEGGDLLNRIQKGSLSQQQAKDIFKQALQAIAYCHSQNIVHRDIKLDNMLFVNSKTLALKIIDFGLAFKWVGDLRLNLLKEKQSKPVGSILYISPECLKAQYNEKSDIWSLSVVLYALVSAQFPFEGKTDKQIEKNIHSMKFTTPIQQLQVSISLKDLLSKIFTPQIKRPSAQSLFDHPWLKQEQQKAPLKLNFGKLANFSKFSKMKTLAVSYIASQLSQKQIEKLSTLFRQLDLNHDGFLSVQEIKKAFENQKQKASLAELSKLISFIDTDKNGKINYTEFISCCLQNSVVYKEQNLKAAFKLLDKDQNGKIQRKQLEQLLRQSGKGYNSKIVEQMMKSCDKNGDGFIDYEQFVASLTKK